MLSESSEEGSLAGAILSGQDPAYNPVKMKASELSVSSQSCFGLELESGVKNSQNQQNKLSTHRIHSMIPSPLSLHPHSQLLFLLSISQRNRSNQKKTFHHCRHHKSWAACLCLHTHVPYLAACSPNWSQLPCKAKAS